MNGLHTIQPEHNWIIDGIFYWMPPTRCDISPQCNGNVWGKIGHHGCLNFLLHNDFNDFATPIVYCECNNCEPNAMAHYLHRDLTTRGTNILCPPCAKRNCPEPPR